MRPPGVWGKATVMPGVNPLPFSSSVPWVETSCALVLHLAVGMQLTLVIRTVRTCRLVEACLGAVLCDGTLLPVAPTGALVEPVGAVPPGFAAPACAGGPIRRHPLRHHSSSAKATAARENIDRSGAPFANKKIPPRRKPGCLEPAAIDLSRCVCTNR